MSRILPGTGAYFLRRSFQDDPIYKESLRGFIDYAGAAPLPPGVLHRGRALALGQAPAAALRDPELHRRRRAAQRHRRRAVRADLDRLRPDPRAVRVRAPEPGRREGGRELRVPGAPDPRARARASSAASTCASPSRSRCASTSTAHGDDRLVVEKLAFEISNEINARARRSRPRRWRCSVLLGAGKRALGEAEFIAQAALLVDYAHERGIALTRGGRRPARSRRCAAPPRRCARHGRDREATPAASSRSTT